MSRLPHIASLLSSFCEEAEPNVLLLKGAWGSGKSYFVADYFKKHPPTQHKYVSFVSFFGADSIGEIKGQILPNALTKKELSSGQTKGLLRRAIGLSAKLPAVNTFKDFFASIGESETKDLIVVFDDVERKLAKFSMEQVLGFTSILSDQLGCKVLMILNEDELKGKDLEDIKLYREKIFDQEILFEPSLEENARLFFKDAAMFERALQIFNDCDTRNLRVIKKCYLHISYLRSKLSTLGKPTLEVILRKALLLACVYYSKGTEVDFSRLSDYGYVRIFGKEDDKTPEGTKLLTRLGFEPEDFDSLIVEYLQTGILNDQALIKTA